MKNLSISRQLIVLVVALMAAFSVATFYQLKSATDAIYEERYGMLRTQVQSAISILQSFHDKETAGTLSREEAMNRLTPPSAPSGSPLMAICSGTTMT